MAARGPQNGRQGLERGVSNIFFSFPVVYFSHRALCSDQKTYLEKVSGSTPKPFQTPSDILGPLAAILYF